MAAAVAAFASSSPAGILTLSSGPNFNPAGSFINNTIVADTIVNGGLIHLVGSSTITPAASNATIDLSGTFAGDAGEKFSVAYEFAVDSKMTTPVPYTITATLNGAPIQPFTGTIMPGLHSYQGSAASLGLVVPMTGNFTAALAFDFGSTAAPAAPGSLDFSIQQVDFQLDPLPASLLPPSQPQNLSTRGFVGNDEDVLIGGFIITGNDDKQVVLRGLGPSLVIGGIAADALADPVLELHDSTGAIVATNDNWQDNSPADRTFLTDNNLAPTDDAESALVQTLAPGAYTTVMRGANGSIGIGLVEIYDLDAGATDSKLANISSRADVGANAQVAIGGFIVGGGGFSTLIVRGLGPSLSDSSIGTPLADPYLELHNANGDIIDSNDNWMDNPNMDQISANGLAPSDLKESALYEILPAGEYTAILSGQGSVPVGIGLVEIYDVDGPAPAN